MTPARAIRTTLAVAALALSTAAGPAQAVFPGQNGKIAFDSGSPPVVTTMNPDGTNQTALRPGAEPAWSPDGASITFTRQEPDPGPCCNIGSSIYAMPADGSSETLKVQAFAVQWNETATWQEPAWSPDGSTLAMAFFECTDVCGYGVHVGVPPQFEALGRSPAWRPYGAEIAYDRFLLHFLPRGLWAMKPDGSGQRQIWVVYRNFPEDEIWDASNPDYSPTGGQVVFSTTYPDGGDSEVFVVPAEGGPLTRLTDNSADDAKPVWSPDGTRIAFVSDRDGNDEIYTMNADGSNQVRITNDAARQDNPSWQPLAHPGYPRPKGATPVRVSLVPSFTACTSPNRTHGPPLAYGSCNPPARESTKLTMGTPDANGAPVNLTGSVRYRTIVGNPGTPQDEADLRLEVEITDVREQATLDDYAGEVEAQATARMIDRDGGVTATAVDVRFPLTTPCTPTALTVIGSTCSLNTTLDTLIPGAVVEGARTILQLGQVRVIDGGPDGDTATEPNTVFLRQGVFVP